MGSGGEMSELVRQITIDGIRRRSPHLDSEALALELIERLHGAAVAHMITGSLASAYHGEPRATRDIDVVIDPDGGSIELLVEAFPPDRFYVGDAAGAVDRRDMGNIVDRRSGWKVDLIVLRGRSCGPRRSPSGPREF